MRPIPNAVLAHVRPSPHVLYIPCRRARARAFKRGIVTAECRTAKPSRHTIAPTSHTRTHALAHATRSVHCGHGAAQSQRIVCMCVCLN